MEFITNNSLACLDDLTNDLEQLESIKQPKKKQKKMKLIKKKKRVFDDSEDEDISESASSERK